MSNTIILSINPEYVNNIINGSKRYEYRTRIAKSDITKILIYETSPIKKIVAEVEVEETLKLPPNQLWEKTRDYSGTTKYFFDLYFKDKPIAYAYKLGNVIVYEKPKEMVDFGLKAAPQSFVYVSI